MEASSDETPLREVCEVWRSLISSAGKHRQHVFGDTADLCMRFYVDSHDFIYDRANERTKLVGSEVPAPQFKATVNKVAELVQLFGPHLYHRNPYRRVLPRRVELSDAALRLLHPEPDLNPMLAQMDPAAYQQQMMIAQFVQQMRQQTVMQRQKKSDAAKVAAELQGLVLNYLPNEFGLKQESRLAIDESLISGRGFLLHEMHSPPGDKRLWLPKSSFVSWRRVYIDPDATCLRDATWIAVEFEEPYWEVEREFGLPSGSLQKYAKSESSNRSAAIESSGESRAKWDRSRGAARDLVRYRKVFSKAGMGHRISSPKNDAAANLRQERYREVLEQFGDHCFLVVCDDVPFPLNLPPEVQNADLDIPENHEDLMRRVRWPVPFYQDEGQWPVSELDLHPVPGDLWPMAHLAPALGELMFLDWVMSWLMGRIQFTGRALVAMAGHVTEEVEDRIRQGADLEVIKLSGLNRSIKEAVEILTFPEVNPDVWRLVDIVSAMFDKRTGLTELMYGMSGKQMRSASEAQLKEERTSIRPDDMADRVEDWQTVVARKEAIMLRKATPPQSVAGIFREEYDPTGQAGGPMGGGQPVVGELARLWGELVYRPDDDDAVFREYDYEIGSGSIRKPNIERDQSNADMAAQMWLPLLQQHAMNTGDYGPLNNFSAHWAEAHGLPKELLALAPPPPPPPVDDGTGGPDLSVVGAA